MTRKRVRDPDDPTFQITTVELSKLLGVDRMHVQRMRMAGLAQVGRGRFALSEILAWLQSQHGGDDDAPSLSDAKRDLAVVQKAKVEIEIRRLHNELVPYEEVKHLMMGVIQVLVSGLDALPARTGSRLAAMTSTAKAEDEIEDECRHIRSQLSAALGRFSTDYRPIARLNGAAAEAARGPVGGPEEDTTTGEP